jgi:hypothetical protein
MPLLLSLMEAGLSRLMGLSGVSLSDIGMSGLSMISFSGKLVVGDTEVGGRLVVV